MRECGRNDPCPCGSGKKFKKCCQSKRKTFSAVKLEIGTGSTSVNRLAHSVLKTERDPLPSNEPLP